AIAGFAEAVKLNSSKVKFDHRQNYYGFKHQLVDGLKNNGIDVAVNGKLDEGELPHVINLWFKDRPADALLTNLDLKGISASAGSACTAGSLEPSHVLTAMYGKGSPRISESLRFSFGAFNTAADIEAVITALTSIIKK